MIESLNFEFDDKVGIDEFIAATLDRKLILDSQASMGKIYDGLKDTDGMISIEKI